jgi:hypothetical protein
MKNFKYFFSLFIGLFCVSVISAQAYKEGDKLEALIGNSWKEVYVSKPPAGKSDKYEVLFSRTSNGKTITTSHLLDKTRLRPIPKTTFSNPVPAVVTKPVSPNLHLGRYELYSGIPSMYLGHLVLLADGRYKIAFDNDEDNYDESGKYRFDENTSTIEWLSGMFKNNNWGGKLIKKDGTGYRIEFNKATFADSSN